MRNLIAALSISLLLSTAALAQDATNPTFGAGATSQPKLPTAMTDPAAHAATSNNKPDATKAMPAKPVAPPATSAATTPVPGAAKDSGGKSDSYLIKDAPLPGDHVLGKTTAPLIMIEYASLSCPHCAHFSNDVLPELQKKYIDTGKMRYILRPFPLNEPALKGAMLVDCVGEQDNSKYYLFSHVLFDAQSKWAFDGNWMDGLETIATVGGLSHDQFQRCVNNTDREMKILKIQKLANDELHVPHTPYIFIGGEAYDGDRSIEEISKVIDAKLASGRK